MWKGGHAITVMPPSRRYYTASLQVMAYAACWPLGSGAARSGWFLRYVAVWVQYPQVTFARVYRLIRYFGILYQVTGFHHRRRSRNAIEPRATIQRAPLMGAGR